MKKLLLSIIVPIYNVEQFLQECIESIINCNSRQIEIILVDDGSPDNCPSICDFYALQDKRIKVIHKKNGGLSSARNSGLDVAKGEYIWFIDSDDFLIPNSLNILLNYLTKHLDVYCMPLFWSFNDKSKNFIDINVENNIFISGLNYLKNRELPVWAIQRFIIRKEFLDKNNIKFPNGLLHEDEYFGRVLMYNVSSILILSKSYYIYRQRSNSIVHSYNAKSIYDYFEISLLLKLYISKNKMFSSVVIEDYFLFIVGIFKTASLIYEDEYKVIYHKYYKSLRIFIMKNFWLLGLLSKLKASLFFISPRILYIRDLKMKSASNN